MPAWRGCNCCSVRRPGVRRLQQHFLLRSCYSHHSMLYCGRGWLVAVSAFQILRVTMHARSIQVCAMHASTCIRMCAMHAHKCIHACAGRRPQACMQGGPHACMQANWRWQVHRLGVGANCVLGLTVFWGLLRFGAYCVLGMWVSATSAKP